MNLKIDGVYVVHAPIGYEKQELYTRELLTKHKFDFEFVNEASLIDKDVYVKQYFTPTAQRSLSKGALFCTLSHILCYKKMIANNNKLALILEDDPYFLDGFDSMLDNIIDELGTLEPGFMISLENSTLCFPNQKEVQKGKYTYPATKGRCAGAYLMDLKAAQNIVDWLENTKCDKVIDHWHNTLIENNVIRMYWAHPAIAEQCSLNGKMTATISSRKKGYIRHVSWLAQKYYKMYILQYLK